MNLELRKTKILNDTDFHLITIMNSTLAEKMIRNKYLFVGKKYSNTKILREIVAWLENETNGLIYMVKKNTPKDFNMYLYFEDENDAVAFKLRWL